MATVFTKKIAATGDDGRNTAPASGADTWLNTSLYTGLVGAGYKQAAMGLRFNSVTIPQGATILSASIQLTPKETDSAVDKTCKIYGVDIDDAAAWSNSNLPNDAEDGTHTATRTTAKADWTIPAISYTPYSEYITYEDVPNYTSTSSARAPGTGSNVDNGGVAWITPSGIAASDNSYTAAFGASTGGTDYLQATNFGFNIPSGATIDGISASIERISVIDGIGSSIVDSTVKIIKGGSLGSTNKASADAWPASDGTKTYGSSTDKWGETWTYSDINASNFGVSLSAFSTLGEEGTSWTAGVDYISITVYYTYISSYTSTPTTHYIYEAVYPISTPDISTVVKEIVDRAGWTPGSDMAFAITPDTGTTAWDKEFFDYTASATYAATLSVIYTSATYAINLSSNLFSEDEKAHICIAGNDYAFGRLSPSYPLALAGTFTQALNSVDMVAQMGLMTFVAGDDGATRPIFAKTATTYINNLGQMTIETPVVEGEFEGIKIHFGTDLALNSATLSSWIQVYTKSDNESTWSSAIDLVAENSEQYIEGFVSTNKNLQAKIVIDPIDSSTPNKLNKIEIY